MITKCPKCKYERKKTDVAPEWQCPKCLTAYAKASSRPPVPGAAVPAGAPGSAPNAADAAATPKAKARAAPRAAAAEVDEYRIRTLSYIVAGVMTATALSIWELRPAGHLVDYRGIVFAVLIPAWIYVVAKFKFAPLFETLAATAAPNEEPAAEADGKQVNAGRIFGWVLRIVIYAAVGLYVVRFVTGYMNFKAFSEAGDCESKAEYCIDRSTGILKSLPALKDFSRPLGGKSRIPCNMVGVWSQRGEDNAMIRITLNEDGTYSADANVAMGTGYPPRTGYWAVQGDNLVWRHKQGLIRGLDVNPMAWQGPDNFTLTEQDGRHTMFERILAAPATKCSQ